MPEIKNNRMPDTQNPRNKPIPETKMPETRNIKCQKQKMP